MHDIVMEEFESHLSGNAPPAFYAHLDACAACRAAVAEMDAGMPELTLFLKDLNVPAETAPEPALGFYNRLTYRIVATQRREAWGLFSPGAAFFRRIAFASLLLLATLGGFLVSKEASESGADTAAVMAQQDENAPEQPTGEIRDHLLVTLASYPN